MSDDKKTDEGQKANGEGQRANIDDVMKRIEQLEATKQRLLEESTNHKAKASEYKAKLDEIEKKKVEETGDAQKIIDYERKKAADLDAANKKLKGETLNNRIESAVKEFAKDAHNIKDLLNQPEFAYILKAGIDQEHLTISSDAVKDYVNKVYEAKPYLKKNVHQANVDTTKANGTRVADAPDYSKMSSKEIMEDIKKKHK